MVEEGILGFKGKRVLLLQGPMGPFFKNLSYDLKQVGAKVFKINFNGGDCFFYPNQATLFRGNAEQWPSFLEAFLAANKIESILLFGDCRKLHKLAKILAKSQNIEVGVFEEGYVRPNYITLDRGGVNSHSSIPRYADFYLKMPLVKEFPEENVGNIMPQAIPRVALYYFFSALLYPMFRRYKHHRSLSPLDAIPQILSFVRKYWYQLKEFGQQRDLVLNHSKKFFLVPLQVYNDAQIYVHSPFKTNQEFIETVISSFAKNAPRNTVLVIKQHPKDRGFQNYTSFIRNCAQKYGVEKRFRYIHDQHLPTLLQHARGVVLINSTVGLSAIHHNRPLKVCGEAIYDIVGLTYQNCLDQFWRDAQFMVIKSGLYQRFRSYLIEHTQLNGSFYKRLSGTSFKSGVSWQHKEIEKENSAAKSLPLVNTGIRKQYG